MVIQNVWSAKKSPIGEIHYWLTDFSSGTIWVCLIVEDFVEIQNTWATTTYITIRRNGLSAEKEGAVIEKFRCVLAGDKLLRKYVTKL